MARQKLTGTVHVNAYAVIRRAVEEGVSYGYRRAHKHMEHPDPEAIKSAIEDAVMGELCEWLGFGEDAT